MLGLGIERERGEWEKKERAKENGN